MGKKYILINKTKNAYIFIGGKKCNISEMMLKKRSNFVVWIMMTAWKNDHVVFADDKEMKNRTDYTIIYNEKFEEYILNNKNTFFSLNKNIVY
jgi:hypothetical protein